MSTGPYRVHSYGGVQNVGMKYRAIGPDVVGDGHSSEDKAYGDEHRLNRAYAAGLAAQPAPGKSAICAWCRQSFEGSAEQIADDAVRHMQTCGKRPVYTTEAIDRAVGVCMELAVLASDRTLGFVPIFPERGVIAPEAQRELERIGVDAVSVMEELLPSAAPSGDARAEAERIASYLFRDSTGHEAHRLAMEFKDGPKFNSPGWGRGAVVDAIALAIAAALRGRGAARTGHVIDDKGVERRVLGTLPLTADGCVVGESSEVFLRGSAVVGPYTANVHADHRGGGCFKVFAHEHHVYSTRERALAARTEDIEKENGA